MSPRSFFPARRMLSIIPGMKILDQPRPLRPPGYEDDVILKKYWRNCKLDERGYEQGEYVDCSNAIKVYLDINPHELKKVDDQLEQFEMAFVMKMFWRDPKLHSFSTRLVRRAAQAAPVAAEELLKPQFVVPLEEVEGVVRRKYTNGDILFVEKEGDGFKEAVLVRKDEYVSLEEPEWKYYFFPHYSLLNLVGENQTAGRICLLWCDEASGGFVEYVQRYNACFQETLELNRFPMDRQICRIKMTAEADVQEFQFVVLDGEKSIGKVPSEWRVENEMQRRCTTYVRYADERCPYHMQRSLVKLVIHLQRNGQYYFHNVLINIFLVNIIALSCFAIPMDNIGERLGLISTTLVAVTAYQTVINSSIPRKTYLTACDKYVIYAVFLQVLITLETVVLGFLLQANDWAEEIMEVASFYDWIFASIFAGGWILSNVLILLLWDSFPDSWKAVYEGNQEPYAPVQQCLSCRGKWLCRQATHHKKDGKLWCPFCNENRPSKIAKHYYTPGCKGFKEPLVPRPTYQQMKSETPWHLKHGDPSHAAGFNQIYESHVLE